jgi:hypothetical protein
MQQPFSGYLNAKRDGSAISEIELLTGEDQHPAVDIYTRNGYRITRRETVIGIPSVRMCKELESFSGE